MKYLIVLIFCFASCKEVRPQSLSTSECQNYIDTFFVKYKSSPGSAIDYIFSTNKLVNPVDSQIIILKKKLLMTINMLGQYTGEDLITQKDIANNFIAYSYMVKYERQPLRFTFIFYKPIKDWGLYKFQFDDRLEEELEEASKIYFLKQ